MFLAGAIMPSSFGFDKLDSINKSLPFIQFILNKHGRKCSVLRYLSVACPAGIRDYTLFMYHVVNYFTVYLTIDKLPRLVIIPLQYWTANWWNKITFQLILPQLSTPGIHQAYTRSKSLNQKFISFYISLSLCRTQPSSSSLANKHR